VNKLRVIRRSADLSLHTSHYDRIPFTEANHEQQAYFHLLTKLQTSLEIEVLLESFFEYLNKNFLVRGLSFCYTDSLNTSNVQEQYAGMLHMDDIKHSITVKLKGEPLGKLELRFTTKPSLNELRYIQSLSQTLSYPLSHAQQYHKVKQLATRDSLTALHNRLEFDQHLGMRVNNKLSDNSRFNLLVLDLDAFKDVNDNYGHRIGDTVLIAFARALSNCINTDDHAFRIGGDEFAILQTGSPSTAQLLIDTIHQAINNEKTLRQYDMSASIGCANAEPTDSIDSIFVRADRDLYRHKKQT